MDWSTRVKEILSIGRNLDDCGVNNWALTKAQALKVLDKFRQLHIPVAGGDIYEIINDKPNLTYNNWYYNREKSETDDDYLLQSIKKAEDFISHYKSPSKREIFVVLVPNDAPR